MKKFAEWFTSDRRKKIQVFLGSLAPLAIMMGFGSQGSWEQVGIITGAASLFLASLLNLLNVRVADWATQGWMIVRGAVYALGTTVSPALVVLGLYGEEVNTAIVTGLGLGLGALSSLISIFANGEQTKAAQELESRLSAQRAYRQGVERGLQGD